MHVTNDQHCTLIIGGVKIGPGRTEQIDAKWEERCEALARVGALKIAGRSAPQASVKDQTKALLAKLSPAERAELGLPPADGPAAAPSMSTSGSSDMTPEEFALCHVATAKAFVKGCNDIDLLCKYAENEARPTVVEALSKRVRELEEAAAKTAN